MTASALWEAESFLWMLRMFLRQGQFHLCLDFGAIYIYVRGLLLLEILDDRAVGMRVYTVGGRLRFGRGCVN
jgi:hypothetical protein